MRRKITLGPAQPPPFEESANDDEVSVHVGANRNVAGRVIDDSSHCDPCTAELDDVSDTGTARSVQTRHVQPRPDHADHEHDAAVAAVAFARHWLFYGGADSFEIFTTFGLTPAQFAQRLRRALDTPAVQHRTCLTNDSRGQLRDEARRMAAMDWPDRSTSNQQQKPQV